MTKVNLIKLIYRIIKRKVYSHMLKLMWNKKNSHNDTHMENIFDIQSVTVGRGTYGKLRVVNVGSDKSRKLHIGNYCSIAGDVTFVLAGEHNIDTISTYPFKTKIINPGEDEAGSKGDIIVEDDVWIGQGVIILSGVTVRQGAVIGAGSLVREDVPPYAIVGGVPARVIKYRFSDEIISKLLTLDFGKLTNEKIMKNQDMLYKKITNYNVDDLLNCFK